MRLTSFEVDGFRSIKSLALRDLGPHVVFYGPNGAGKSNILAAVDRFWAVLGIASRMPDRKSASTLSKMFRREDVHVGGREGRMRFAGQIEFPAPAEEPAMPFVCSMTFEALVDLPDRGDCELRRVRLSATMDDGETLDLTARESRPIRRSLIRTPLSASGAKRRALEFALNLATRHPLLAIPALRGAYNLPPTIESPDPTERAVLLAMAGCVEEAVFVAHTSPDLALVERLNRLRSLLASAPLNRPQFRPVRDEARGIYSIQELLSADGKTIGVPLELSGLGVQQLYAILTAIMLSNAPIVTLEEPEAHLYEPGTGLDLRHILQRLVPDEVSQLFTATHSSLFDLNPAGYWDVGYSPDLGTTVRWSDDLTELDRRHVYEPGAARHALLMALRHGEPDRTVAWRPDRTPVSTSEMIQMLVDDDPIAFDFLSDVTAAAVRAVAQRASR